MAGQETLIYIEENDKNEAGINARHFAKEDVQNRAYYNTLGAQLIKKFLASENVDAANTYNIHSIKKVLEELDIADIMLNNIHIDVRVVFNENFIFIPKSHFKYEILPDIYLVLLMSNDKKYVKILGFFEPKLINKNNQNEDYYFIEKEKLNPATNLKEFIENFKGNTEQNLSDSEIENSDILILSMIDHDITEDEKKELLQNLVKSAKLRDRFIEFENFETLSYRAEQAPDVKKPETLSGYPSLEVAAAATAEALEQLDFGGSANTQKLPDENEIINGFNNLERNIPDLTPKDSTPATDTTSVDDILSELVDFSNLEDLTADEVSTAGNTETQSSSENISIEELAEGTPYIQPEEQEKAEQHSETQEAELTTEELNALTLNFDDISQTDTTEEISPENIENISSATDSGIIEQQDTPETLNFDEIMPLETPTDDTPSNIEHEEISDETIDFRELENPAPEEANNQTPETPVINTEPETVNFEDITTPADLTEISGQNIEPEIIETETATSTEPELADFTNLEEGLQQVEITDSVTQQEPELADFNNLEEDLQQVEITDSVMQQEPELADFTNLEEDLQQIEIADSVTQQEPELADFNNLEEDLQQIEITDSVTQQEPELADFDNPEETLPPADISDLQTKPASDDSVRTELENESSEPELLLEEPLQELSFDDAELTLEEPLLEISDDNQETTKSETSAFMRESLSDKSTGLEDFDNLVLQDEKAHGIERPQTPVQKSAQENTPEILPEDAELDKMLSDENLTALSETAHELTTDKSAADNPENIEETLPDKPTSSELLSESAEKISGAAAEIPEELTAKSDLQPQPEETAEDTITDLNLDADEIEKSTVTDDIAGVEGFDELQNNTELSTDELISQIDDLLGTTEPEEHSKPTASSGNDTSEPENDEASDKGDKLEMLFNSTNGEIDDNTGEFEEETGSTSASSGFSAGNLLQGKGKQAILAAAVVAVLAIAGGAGFFLMKNKNSSDMLSQNPVESGAGNLPVPESGSAGEDNTDLMTNAPDINNQVPTPPAQPEPQAKPAEQQAPAPQAKPVQNPQQPRQAAPKPAKPAEAAAAAKAPGNTPIPYVSVKSLTWEVPDYLSYSDKVKKYLQTAGKSIRLTLSSDLLLATEYAYSNQIKVELKLKSDGTVQDAQITKSSGSTQINDIVLRTVKDTLKVVKPAPGEIPTPDFKLGLIINL